MENYIIAKKLEDFSNRISELNSAIHIDEMKDQVSQYEKMMVEPDFYSDRNQSQKILKTVKELQKNIESYQKLTTSLEEMEFYFELVKKGEQGFNQELDILIQSTDENLAAFEIKMLLSSEYDPCDAIIELHPGAGGTESQDWAEMLFRMYRRYAEKQGFGFEVLDYQDGDEAGLKSVIFMITGEKAYGYLKSEHGVHRLVRISPFDSNARRHTSFCSCAVTPSLESSISIDIRPEDIRVDTFRSSGAGGQSVNTTDSAVRITHLKTGIVVSCQNERSQIQNREKAMAVLASKLYVLEQEAQEKKIQSINQASMEISFGSQIRSYVFHPYSMVKDHRTNYEEFNTGAIMDGNIDGYINAYLKSKYNMR